MNGERDEWEGGRQRNEWGKRRGSVADPGGRREKQRKLFARQRNKVKNALLDVHLMAPIKDKSIKFYPKYSLQAMLPVQLPRTKT